LATEVADQFRIKMGNRDFSARLALCQKERAERKQQRKEEIKVGQNGVEEFILNFLGPINYKSCGGNCFKTKKARKKKGGSTKEIG
jgi:hypothetical protein